MDIVDRLDPIQTDYNVIKELRTAVGSTLGNFAPDQDTVRKVALGYYNKFSKVLLEPTNKADKYVKQAIKAIGKSRDQANAMYRNPEVARLFKGEFSPAKLANEFVTDPSALNPHVRAIIDSTPNAKRDLRFQMFNNMLNNPKYGNPFDARDAMMRGPNGNKDAVDWLFRGRGIKESFATAAKGMRRLNESAVENSLKKFVPDIEFSQKLLVTLFLVEAPAAI